VQYPKVSVTMGDPAGVGPELCLKLLSQPAILEHCIPVVFGDVGVLALVANSCGWPWPGHTSVCHPEQWSKRCGDVTGPTVVDCGAIDAATVRPGTIDAACGRAAFNYIEAAIGAALAGEVAAVATGPIHKEALRLAGEPYPGHTEIFAAKTGSRRTCMMLTSEALTVSFVTTHIGYAEVPGQLSVERILDVIELTAGAMLRLRGREPSIVVCGLNPHAGEHGLFGGGDEEKLIGPAIALAQQRGIRVQGPVPPDAAFLPARRQRTDAFVCMYHDQGHIPLKMLAFDSAVNVTLGLPIVRTSVDHGTAFDIAWSGQADPGSLIQAVMLATWLAGGAG
jgi:4-phospho-D-threonate 3-dehydrogenase / 4-phospho-D-erythronate 3-dehydrogenase